MMRTGLGGVLRPVTAALIVVGSMCACMQHIAQSHVDANVPEAGDFDRFMRRDLQAYLESAGYKPVLIHYELLRDAPTQSGIAYPKFYVWLQADTGGGAFTEGVARLAAVDKREFQVTHFLLVSELQQDPGRLKDIFPAPICAEILDRIGRNEGRTVSQNADIRLRLQPS